MGTPGGFGLGNINAKLQMRSRVTTSPSRNPTEEEGPTFTPRSVEKVVRIQQFVRKSLGKSGSPRPQTVNWRRFKVIFLAILKGHRVRKTLKKAQFKRMVKEIKELQTLIRFQSKKSFIEGVIRDKKKIFSEQLIQQIDSVQKSNSTSTKYFS